MTAEPSTSLYHTLKVCCQSTSTTDTTDNPSLVDTTSQIRFEELLRKFTIYSQQIQMCEIEAKAYMKTMYDMFHHAYTFVKHLSPLLMESDSQDIISASSSLSSNDISNEDQVHKVLVTEIQTELTTKMTNIVLNPLSELLSKVQAISQQMEEDKVLHPQYTYYKTKLEQLSAAKRTRQKRNQTDSNVQNDTLNRNTEKFDAAQYSYTTTHLAVEQNMSNLWLNRSENLGVILSNFISIERDIASRSTQALSHLSMTWIDSISTAPVSTTESVSSTAAASAVTVPDWNVEKLTLESDTSVTVTEGLKEISINE